MLGAWRSEPAGHELVDLDAAEAMIDFTTPDAVEANVGAALERGVPCVIGTTSFDERRIDALARERGSPASTPRTLRSARC